MPKRSDYDAERLRGVLQAQRQVVTRTQALLCGMPHSTVDRYAAPGGRWQRLLPGVYLALTGSATQDQRDMAALAGLAVQTGRVRLGTLMTASTYRRPGPLAITVATVDAMSGGRAELGIGAAWIEQEHRYLGIPFPPLGERFDRLGEQLEIITGLWATPPGERFSFHGKHYRLEECASIPRPARRPPVIIGGAGPRRTPALAARFADEFNSGMPDGLAARFANFRRICEQSGRDPAGVRLSTTLPVCCGPTRAAAARRAAALGEPGARMLAMGVTGTPGDILGRLAELHAAGADTVYFHLYDVTDLDHVRLLGREVLPQVTNI